MAKASNDTVTLVIEENTVIVVGDQEYSGTVEVDDATAKALKETGKVKDHGESINA